MVVDAEAISFSWGDKKIVDGFSTTIIRGDRVGIIGPNGCGKTTLLKILLGDLKPQQGKVRLGAGIKIAYFDQLRAQLDENKTLRENIADGNDTIIMGGCLTACCRLSSGFSFFTRADHVTRQFSLRR